MGSQAEERALRSFGQVIGQLEGGALVSELADKIKDIVAELNNVRADEGGKPKATLSLSLAFKLDGDTIEIVPTLDVKMPARTRHKTVLWTTGDNTLTPANPKQQEMELRDVGGQRQVRDA